uniref:PDZ and LIM domain protein Zasp n=1 Tax=Culex pipiens TaxID=7175 RepID=A0A8D8CY01_CULPI
MANLITVQLRRGEGQPWGFRLQGGKDFSAPLVLQRVNGGSVADQAGLMPGDALVKVNSTDVFSLRHKEAQDVIVAAGNSFELTVSRGTAWRPSVTPTGSIPSPSPSLPGNITPVTKTSLAATPQPAQHIGSGHNQAAKPFPAQQQQQQPQEQVNGSDPIKSIVNMQYNTPVAMYSDETIAETLSSQAEVLAGGVLGVNFKKNEKKYSPANSEVYKMLHEQGDNPEPANHHQQPQQQVQQQQAQQHQHQQYTHPKLVRNGSQNNGQAGMLLHSFSQNDASLGEYKYTVNVGRHSIKITGDCFDLVRVAKLVLDDYFSSNEFLASVEMGSSFDLPSSLASPVTPMAGQHQLITGSPFVDSGVGLDAMAIGGGGGNCIEVDDDVFIVDPPTLTSSSSSNSTLVTSTPSSASNNGLSRSRRSHFSRKDSAPEGIKDGSRDDSTPVRIVHEYERLIYYSKSPHSWALPRDWLKICDKLPYLVRNKDVNDDKGRFNGDKFLEMKKQSTLEDGGTGGAGDTSGESAERDEVPPSSTTPKTTTADGESGSGTTSTTTATATTTIASESKEG